MVTQLQIYVSFDVATVLMSNQQKLYLIQQFF